MSYPHLTRWLASIGALALALLLYAPTPQTTTPAAALDDGLARTPPMGWNTWNRFGCDIDSQLIRKTADAMVASGMQAVGYQYVVIDDCWQTGRDANGNLFADPVRFPGGIAPLADYVHQRGLKLGLYTSAGAITCMGRPGSLGHEVQDMAAFAAWGVDFVKIDWCGAENQDARQRYAIFRDAIAQTSRPMVISICEWGAANPWEWGADRGHMWRTTGDIFPTWRSIVDNIDANGRYNAAAGAGRWNDPDMLQIGNGRLTLDEQKTHMSMWALMAAPLIAGNDLRTMDATIHALLTNPEVIAVDQDSLGVQGVSVWDSYDGLQVWSRPLADGSRAVVLFNRRTVAAPITVAWSMLGLPSDSAAVRDLWARGDLGTFAGSFSAPVPAHGVIMLRVAPVGTQHAASATPPPPVAPAPPPTAHVVPGAPQLAAGAPRGSTPTGPLRRSHAAADADLTERAAPVMIGSVPDCGGVSCSIFVQRRWRN